MPNWISLDEAAERAGFAGKTELLSALPAVAFDGTNLVRFSDQGPAEIDAEYLEAWMARRSALMLWERSTMDHGE